LVNTATSCPYLGGTVAALANCTIDVTFTPEATGARAGSVAITDNAGGSPQAIQLTGTGDVTVALTVTPTSLSFGNQLLGTSGTPQGVIVTNPAAAAISISSLAISNGWTETDNCLPSIPANSSCNIHVVFAPTAGGNQTGSITLTDDAENSPQIVTLSGTALAPVVTLSTQSLTFAAQAVSITSAAQTILLTNTGSGGLTPLTIGTTGDFAQTNNCAVPVSPGIACTIGVTFTPTAGGVRNGTLTLTDNAVNSPQIVLLTGIGQGAMASLSATSLTFAGQAVATASAPQTITLSNPGGLTLTNLTMSMNGDFSQTNTCGGSVPAGANCTISVTFTPTASGARTGTLTLTDTAANSPQTVTLSGTGLGSGVNLSASSLTFTGQTVSTQSGAQTITLTNTGNAALTPLTITRSGPFAETNTCPASLAGGASCTISVTFAPLSAGSQSGTITVTDNAANSPQTIALSGTGMDFTLSSSTTSQTVSAGQTANYSLTLSPADGFSQTVNLTCTGAPTLATCTLTPNSAALNGTASATVAVAVTTTAPTTAMLAPPAGRFPPPSFSGFGKLLWLYGLLGLATLATLAAARKRRAAYLLGACLLLATLWSACGGGSSTPAPKTVPGTP
ncbi:MAG: choice-of-anchor D domain-containing protein, partial [Terriglobales bacterium]